MDNINKIICCDALEGVKSLDKKSVDFILIDPPYVISTNRDNNNFKDENGGGGDQYRFGSIDLVVDEWDKKQIDFSIFGELYRVLKVSGNLVCFYDIWKMQELRNILQEVGFQQFRMCEWIKNNPVPINSKHNYLSNAKEFFIYCVKGGKATFNADYDNGTYHGTLCHGKERTEHPTQKPLKIIKEIIAKHTKPNDLILDCFIGSGTTAVAAKELGRRFIGFDASERYCEIARGRLDG